VAIFFCSCGFAAGHCGTPDIRASTGDLHGLCQLPSALKRPFLARLSPSPRRGYHKCRRRAGLRRNEIAPSLAGAGRTAPRPNHSQAVRSAPLSACPARSCKSTTGPGLVCMPLRLPFCPQSTSGYVATGASRSGSQLGGFPEVGGWWEGSTKPTAPPPSGRPPHCHMGGRGHLRSRVPHGTYRNQQVAEPGLHLPIACHMPTHAGFVQAAPHLVSEWLSEKDGTRNGKAGLTEAIYSCTCREEMGRCKHVWCW
jgi:hypothetical protein